MGVGSDCLVMRHAHHYRSSQEMEEGTDELLFCLEVFIKELRSLRQAEVRQLWHYSKRHRHSVMVMVHA